MKSFIEEVRLRVLKVYCDCGSHESDWEFVSSRRELDFKSDQSVSRDDAYGILSEAIPAGYNYFSSALLKLLPEGALVWIAREGSVCIYVEGNLPKTLQKELKADEFSYDSATNQTRIWWD